MRLRESGTRLFLIGCGDARPRALPPEQARARTSKARNVASGQSLAVRRNTCLILLHFSSCALRSACQCSSPSSSNPVEKKNTHR
jgi:hypothetical protein